MKELLIIRSVSFQQLDLNLPDIIKQFPDYKISLLTHEHGVELAKKYSEISEIYVYEYTGSFDKKNKVKSLSNKHFDTVIIPVTNITGVGFLNVLKYGLSIKADRYCMCNVVSDITNLSKAKLNGMFLKGALCKAVSALAAAVIAVFFIPYTLLKLKGLCRK